ncbi:MAG: hypothetical protein ACI8Y4_005197 [Candidatus Poriferisodalaceae bacterium]|jgi:hypothetical protein
MVTDPRTVPIQIASVHAINSVTKTTTTKWRKGRTRATAMLGKLWGVLHRARFKLRIQAAWSASS